MDRERERKRDHVKDIFGKAGITVTVAQTQGMEKYPVDLFKMTNTEH